MPLEVYVSKFAHALRADRDDEQPGHPSREADRRLHLTLDGKKFLTVDHQEETRPPFWESKCKKSATPPAPASEGASLRL